MSDIPLNPNIQLNSNSLPSLVQNVVNQFIVLPSGTVLGDGVSGFVFDIIGTEEMSIESDITDHFLEDNTSVQDQIALRPERFTLSGFVGELGNLLQITLDSILTEGLSLGSSFGMSPSFSVQATQAYNQLISTVASAQNVVNEAQSIYGLFSGISTTASKQQNAFQYFYGLWSSRILCQVYTPYGVLSNMAIERINAKQDETTRLVSDFSVTFKHIRVANTLSSNLFSTSNDSLEARADQVVNGTPVSSGTTPGTLEDSSLLSQNFDNLSALQGA